MAAKKAPKGVRITKGSKWTLTASDGRHFKASVIETFTIGGKRVALLSVPTRPKEKRKRA